MNKFQIRDIEALTGIKSHTLRIWEQRYQLCCPKRTETNIRYYDETDLKLLLNISVLNDHGYKISEIAKMSYEEIIREVMALSEDCANFGCQIQSLSDAMLHLDEHVFEKILNTNILKMGLENTMVNIVFPFLKKTGIMWQTNTINPAHEHFVTHLIKQKLLVAIDAQVMPRMDRGKKFLLFLPEGETHEIGLLFANYLIKSKGHHVLYLGANLPCSHLCEVSKFFKPDYVFTMLTSPLINTDLQTFADKLCAKLQKIPLFISGIQILQAEINIPKNMRMVNSVEEFNGILNEIAVS